VVVTETARRRAGLSHVGLPNTRHSIQYLEYGESKGEGKVGLATPKPVNSVPTALLSFETAALAVNSPPDRYAFGLMGRQEERPPARAAAAHRPVVELVEQRADRRIELGQGEEASVPQPCQAAGSYTTAPHGTAEGYSPR